MAKLAAVTPKAYLYGFSCRGGGRRRGVTVQALTYYPMYGVQRIFFEKKKRVHMNMCTGDGKTNKV